MIVDCHTHIWPNAEQADEETQAYLQRQAGRADVSADPADHTLAAECVDKVLIFPATSHHVHSEAPNEFIAEYVARCSDAMIGIAAVDPTDPDVLSAAESLLDRNEFRGLLISPSAQKFHPADSRAMALYELAAERSVPLFFHQGTHFPARAYMEYARPSLLDEIARELPGLRIVISSLGEPWINEGIALLGKHAHVLADISGLIRRPWQMYNGLVLAHQFNVMDKVLFGSGFPYLRAAEAIERIYRLHEISQGTNLPAVPREVLRSMVERDALSALGIARPGELAGVQVPQDED